MEDEGDPVEGGDIWVECWLVIRGVQKPALSTIGDQQHQANIVVTIEYVLSAHPPLAHIYHVYRSNLCCHQRAAATLYVLSEPPFIGANWKHFSASEESHTKCLCHHCKKYLVKMTISEWLLQFQGSLNRWVI